MLLCLRNIPTISQQIDTNVRLINLFALNVMAERYRQERFTIGTRHGASHSILIAVNIRLQGCK